MKERITDVSQLKQGDKIYRIKGDECEIQEFVQLHPYNENYALMMNMNKDCPKFYLPDLKRDNWYRYEDSDECWNDILKAQIEWHQEEITRLGKKLKKVQKDYSSLKEYLQYEMGDGFTNDIDADFEALEELKNLRIFKGYDEVVVKCLYKNKHYQIKYNLGRFTGSLPFHLALVSIDEL